MNLAEWHVNLDAHFRQLHHERSGEGSRPVFALEHGLNAHEVDKLKEDVRAYIKCGSPNNKNWLPWIVYAAELGYDYIGYEYWQTFEESTDGWLQYGDRYYLRDKFIKFCKDYRGAQPTGAWARHFTIICYPITHALLPKDFQRQLAKVLYETRRLFTADVLQSPEQLGELISAHSTEQSDRFQRFVQNTDLVGLIAKELLSHQEQDYSSILLPSTLKRIVKDLEHERNARDWLRDARNYAARATRTHGLSAAFGANRISVSAGHRERTIATTPAIEPNLILRQRDTTCWELLLEVPDFAPLLTTYPSLQSFLNSSRCTVRCADVGHRFARGQLLSYGAQAVPLRTFPTQEEPLLRFEKSVPNDLRPLFDAEFKLNLGVIVLCRIAADGRGYQMRSQLVRPGRSYIILSTTPISPNSLLKPIRISCVGVSVMRLDMPEHMTREHQTSLEKIGLVVAKKICVSPVGFPAASWDEEGLGEWLADEAPCVAVKLDHDVDSILLELDGEENDRLEITPQDLRVPVFVELPFLSIGTHFLRVASRQRQFDRYEEIGRLEIIIKEPRTWRPGINNQGALIVLVDPRAPSLEQLWEGRVSIEIHGPDRHRVTCYATFLGKDSDTAPLASKRLFELQLPLKAGTWKSLVSEQFKSSEIQSAIELAYACRLEFNAGELGDFTINCERKFTPLRWVVERDRDSYRLSLSDDFGSDTPITISRYDFISPDLPTPLPFHNSFHKQHVPPTGGLYLARSQQALCSAIVPREAPRKYLAFADMRSMEFIPQFRQYERCVKSLIDLIQLYELWLNARTTGNMLSGWAQRRVLQAFLIQIFRVICGEAWINAENSFELNHKSHVAIQRFAYAVSNLPQLTQPLISYCNSNAELKPEDRINQLPEAIMQLIPPISLSGNEKPISQPGAVRHLRRKQSPWLMEFALRLASSPERARRWSEEWYESGLNGLLDKPELARIARFLILTVHHKQDSQYISRTSLYSRWDWS